jgi:hypothetical protein
MQVMDDKESECLLVMRRIEVQNLPPVKIVPTFIGFSVARMD